MSGTVKRGIETEVLGPLRIWHIIGISLTILTSAVFMLCCCCNFRVPRTRQQIEENYLKRKINKRYLHLLERNPEKLITKRGKWLRIKDIYKSRVSTTDSSGKINILNSPLAVSQLGNAEVVMQSGDVNASDDAHLPKRTEQIMLSTLFHRLQAPVGVQTPSPFRPRDILAMMAQQPRLVVRQPTLSGQRFRLSARQPNLVAQPARLSSKQSIIMNAQQPRLSARQPTLSAQQPRLSSQQKTLMNAHKPRLSARQPTLGAQQSRFNAQQNILLNEQQPRLNELKAKFIAHQPSLNVQQKTPMNAQQPRLRAQQPRLIAPALNVMQHRLCVQQPSLSPQQPKLTAPQLALGTQQTILNAQQPRLTAPQLALGTQQTILNAQQPKMGAGQDTYLH